MRNMSSAGRAVGRRYAEVFRDQMEAHRLDDVIAMMNVGVRIMAKVYRVSFGSRG